MAGPFTKYTNLDASGPVLYPDSIMNPGMLSVIDFIDDYTFPDGEPVTGTGVFSTTENYKTFDARQSDFEGDPVTFDYAKYSYNAGVDGIGAEVVYDGVKGRNLILPSAWKLAPTLSHFAMAFWFRASTVVTNGFNNRLATFYMPGLAAEQWRIAPIADVGTTVNKLEFYVRPGSTSWDLSTIPGFSINSILNSVINQLVFEYEESPDGASFSQRFYLNGEIIGTRDAVTKSSAFADNGTTGECIIGSPSSFSGSTFTGSFRRAWLANISKSPVPLIKIVEQDFADNIDRMRSF